MSIPAHDPIYGRHYVLTISPDTFYGVFIMGEKVNPPPFRECSLSDLYTHVHAATGDARLTIPQDEMEAYYKARGWAIYKIAERNLLRVT